MIFTFVLNFLGFMWFFASLLSLCLIDDALRMKLEQEPLAELDSHYFSKSYQRA